eukprot:GHVS01019321.1.p1 GENE.GHVS01019321.1~~GHVS01019321.1.p1  ORF type:complete len:405 (+),score=101.93 GHVS01019321.1:237-1451(+)
MGKHKKVLQQQEQQEVDNTNNSTIPACSLSSVCSSKTTKQSKKQTLPSISSSSSGTSSSSPSSSSLLPPPSRTCSTPRSQTPTSSCSEIKTAELLLSLSDQNTEERQLWLSEAMPDELILRDEDLVSDVLAMDLQTLDDMVEYFCIDERLGEDEFVSAGPVKYEYKEGDCYDWHVALGCLNCGKPFELFYHYVQLLEPLVLVCLGCGHRACPRHLAGESDCLVERMEGLHLREGGGDNESRREQQHEQQEQNDEWKMLLLDDDNVDDESMEGTASSSASGGMSPPSSSSSSCSSSSRSSHMYKGAPSTGIYLYGSRKQHNFGQFDKSWWQDNFLSQEFRDGRMLHHLRVVTTMGQKKGVTCQEECLLCGHDRAFYQVYQARSADEGMTIMFECCSCRNRKVFNN